MDRLGETEREKFRYGQPRGAQDFPLAELAAADLDRFRRVLADAKCAGGVGCGRRRPVAQRQDGLRQLRSRLRHNTCSRLLGLLEMQCQGAVGPRVVELVAAVAAEEDLDAEPLRRLGEAPGLI